MLSISSHRRSSGLNPYSTFKAAWHLDRIEALRLGKTIAPVELQLILSDLCNHDCHFCAYRASNGLSTELFVERDEAGEVVTHNPNRQIPTAKALEIVEDAADVGVKSVIFTGGGEPTVHPDHLKVFAAALAKNLDCSLNTNGVLFRPEWEYVYPYFSYVRFSVDAANPKEYAAVRACQESHYGRMLDNLSALRDRVEQRKTDCVVGTGYVVTPENYKNLQEGITRLRDNGAHYVRLAAMQSYDGHDAYKGKWSEAREAALDCAALSTGSFQVVDLMDNVLGERPDYEFCGFQHLVTYVGGNLDVYRCCYTAYTTNGYAGTLADKSFKEYVRTRNLDFDARSCDTCPLNEKNRVIEYMTNPEPRHVNFV